MMGGRESWFGPPSNVPVVEADGEVGSVRGETARENSVSKSRQAKVGTSSSRVGLLIIGTSAAAPTFRA
jgi:hypothetical protein